MSLLHLILCFIPLLHVFKLSPRQSFFTSRVLFVGTEIIENDRKQRLLETVSQPSYEGMSIFLFIT